MSNDPIVACEICAASSPLWQRIRDYPHYRCSSCGHLFVFPRPTQEELDAFYMGGEYYDQAEAEQQRLLYEADQRITRLERLCQDLNLEMRMLDVGCATGYFLMRAVQRGWRAMGIDRSEALVERARENSGATVISGLLEAGDVPDAPFPVVTAWEVIEHTIDPRAFFASLAIQVEPGGLLALSTPLANGLPAKVMGSRFPMLTPPEHISLFTRKSIRLLASEFGFEEVDYRSFSNLNRASLASGLARILFHKEINDLAGWQRAGCQAAGSIMAWLPNIIDRLGFGTEMEIIFRRKPS